MKKILVLVDPGYQDGFHGFLQECHKRGLVVCIGDNKKNFGINIKSYTSFISKFLSRSAIWIPSYNQLKKILIENEISDIHIIGEPTYLSVFICCLIKKFNKNLNLQISCRTAQNMQFRLPFPFNFVLEFSRKSDVKVFPVSKLSKKYAQEVYRIGIFDILPTGVPDEFFRNQKNNLKRNTILFVGSFLERKGIHDFIELSIRLKKQKPKLNFVAVGGSIKNIANINHNQTHFIKFIPLLSREKLIEFNYQSIMLIMPSKTTDGSDMPLRKKIFGIIPWSEQFGRVIIEAYSRGTPVYAYNSGAINEYIYNRDYLVEENNIDELEKKAIRGLECSINHNDLINYSKGYKWSTVCQRFLEIRNSIF